MFLLLLLSLVLLVLQYCVDGGRGEWFVWCRWGRVGEEGATAELGPFADKEAAAKAFAKKFRDKTGNKWEVLYYRQHHHHAQQQILELQYYNCIIIAHRSNE